MILNQIKMKKIISIALILFTFQMQKSVAQNSERRVVEPFNKIIVANSSKIILLKDSVQSIQFENENPFVKTAVVGTTLKISGASARMTIRLPELESIGISGNASIASDSSFSMEKLALNISGNGKITLAVNVKDLDIDISGRGKVTVSGTANRLNVNISGDAKVEAENLKVHKCETNISGVAKCSADVSDELLLNISGTGSFYYLAKPVKIDAHISGIGKHGILTNTNGIDTTKNENAASKMEGSDKNDDDYECNVSLSDSTFHRHEKARSHWGGLDLGFNQLMTGKKFSTTLPDKDSYLDLNSGKSINVNINIFYHDFPIFKRYMMFTTGIGLTINNYRFNSDQTLRSDTNRVAVDYDHDKNGKKIAYEKNKLLVAYFTVPLLLQFNTKQESHNSFHIAVGLLCSYKFNSHLKLVYNVDGTREKTKRHDDYNIDPFRYDATVRLGYDHYTIYASYALSELFKTNRGPEVHPFQFGISLSGW